MFETVSLVVFGAACLVAAAWFLHAIHEQVLGRSLSRREKKFILAFLAVGASLPLIFYLSEHFFGVRLDLPRS